MLHRTDIKLHKYKSMIMHTFHHRPSLHFSALNHNSLPIFYFPPLLDVPSPHFTNTSLLLTYNQFRKHLSTWCVQVLRSPKEAFAAAMQSWRERCEKFVSLQGDYVEK